MKKVQITLLLMLVVFSIKAQISYVETDLDPLKYDGAQFAVVSPDGKFVYLAAANDDAIAIFSRNDSDGKLTFSSLLTDGTNLNNVREIIISDDGEHLYSVGINSNNIAHWSVNTTTGALTLEQSLFHNVDGVSNMDGPLYLVMSHDQKNIYVSVQNVDALTVFDRNTTTGDLTFKETHVHNAGTGQNIDSPKGIAISPDDKTVYIAASANDGISVFDRNTSTGALTFNEFHGDGATSPTLLDQPWTVKVSPDGKFVYTACRRDDAITVFSRDASTGDLTFAFEYGNGTNGLSNLSDGYQIAIRSDGKELYLAGGTGDAAIVFAVNTTTGALTLTEEEVEGGTGLDAGALNNVYGVTVEPDDQHVYFVLQFADGISTFSIDNPPVSAPTSATVAATVFLEGAYNGTNLNTSLNSDIPLTQPYSNNGHTGGSAASIPANAVDWVLVELREAGSAAAALNSTKVGSTAGFLMQDGTVKATDGTSDLTISLSGNSGADFFVVIYHRNHLPIMSASAISESGSKYTIDFTSNSANTHQTTTALASLSGGKFGMPSGDADGDGDVDGTDLTTWRSQNGNGFTYNTTNADFNLDGEINAIDRNLFWKANNTSSKTSQVPTT